MKRRHSKDNKLRRPTHNDQANNGLPDLIAISAIAAFWPALALGVHRSRGRPSERFESLGAEYPKAPANT
jgi:hypothetical protein